MQSTSLPVIKQYNYAILLAYISIALAFFEALFSLYFGISDETLSLSGFGIGSLIEVVSAIGVANMIMRIKQNPTSNKSRFERTALVITGTSFYILAAGLIITCVINIVNHHLPQTTKPAVIISLCSVILMSALVSGKTKAGKRLNSKAILADAECTKVCIYTSAILLIAAGIYASTSIPYIDEAGTLGIAYFSFKEGIECFKKAKSNDDCCCC